MEEMSRDRKQREREREHNIVREIKEDSKRVPRVRKTVGDGEKKNNLRKKLKKKNPTTQGKIEKNKILKAGKCLFISNLYTSFKNRPIYYNFFKFYLMLLISYLSNLEVIFYNLHVILL